VSREEELLGTAGGLRAAGRLLGPGDVLVWNGDMIGRLDVPDLLAAHARGAAAGALAATLVVQRRADDRGNTGLDRHGHVVRLRRETCAAGEVATADFLGVYVVGEVLRRGLPARGDVIAEALLPAMKRGLTVEAYATDAALVDVGTPRAYLEANMAWLARTARPERSSGVVYTRNGARSWAGEGVVVGAGVTVEGVVLGAGARVEGEGRVERCVVWPGAVARAPLADAVVAREGTVRA
jgi:mannose-1-phosphate guanylyltransferase